MDVAQGLRRAGGGRGGRAVDGTTRLVRLPLDDAPEQEDDEHDDGGNCRNHQAVLDCRGALFVVVALGEHEAKHFVSSWQCRVGLMAVAEPPSSPARRESPTTGHSTIGRPDRKERTLGY